MKAAGKAYSRFFVNCIIFRPVSQTVLHPFIIAQMLSMAECLLYLQP